LDSFLDVDMDILKAYMSSRFVWMAVPPG